MRHLILKAIMFNCILVCSTNLFGQQICFSYKGAWSDWHQTYGVNISKYTNGSGYVLKTSGGIEFFDFRITGYHTPSKKEIKDHKKTNTWYEYTGVVSYYVSDTYPTADAIAKNNRFVEPDPRTDTTPRVKRTTTATIKIAPYKHSPEIYNIWFDNIGVGIAVKGLSFEGDKKRRHGGRFALNLCLSIFTFPIGLVSWWANPVRE